MKTLGKTTALAAAVIMVGLMAGPAYPQSRELLSEFEGSGRFVIAATPISEPEMQELLDRGKVDGVVRVLPGFARDVERGRRYRFYRLSKRNAVLKV